MELNEIVDGLLRCRFPDASLIQTETKPVFKSFISNLKESMLEPPPPDIDFFPKEFFSVMTARNLINYSDAEYMFSTIDSSVTYKVDSTKFSKRCPARENKCFLKVSTPIFNMEFTKAILAVDYYCGPINGSGYNIVLEKLKDKWVIIYEYGTWKS